MRKIILIFAMVVFCTVAAQDHAARHMIDSIYQRQRDSAAIDLDSLANPKPTSLPNRFRNKIVVKEEVLRPYLGDDVPLTPYYLISRVLPKKWFLYGQNSLSFNQASFSNWNSGGNNNIGVLGRINYNLSYRNRRHFLENILQTGYGLVAYAGQSTRKTDDALSVTSNYGYDMTGDYYLSAGLQFLTQFAPGYNYENTPNPSHNDRISAFMAPAYLSIGVGVSYNPSDDLQIILRPVNGKFTFVEDPLLQRAGHYGLERDGQSVRSELGAMANILYRIKIYKDMNIVNQLNLFSNYLYHPERVDINYSGLLNMRFNKFISTLVGVEMVYDHDQLQHLQLKQTLSVGFSYNFGTKEEGAVPKKAVKLFGQ